MTHEEIDCNSLENQLRWVKEPDTCFAIYGWSPIVLAARAYLDLISQPSKGGVIDGWNFNMDEAPRDGNPFLVGKVGIDTPANTVFWNGKKLMAYSGRWTITNESDYAWRELPKPPVAKPRVAVQTIMEFLEENK